MNVLSLLIFLLHEIFSSDIRINYFAYDKCLFQLSDLTIQLIHKLKNDEYLYSFKFCKSRTTN